jgi:hypothetical protein
VPLSQPHVIEPSAVYTVESLRAALGLPKSTVGREVRLGRLRVTKRAGKYFILGSWVLEWLEKGELGHNRKREMNQESNA